MLLIGMLVPKPFCPKVSVNERNFNLLFVKNKTLPNIGCF